MYADFRSPGYASQPSCAIDIDDPHPRAVEMAEKMREAAGAFGHATWGDLVAAGFSSDEIVEHETLARTLAGAGFVRQVTPAGDRVPDFLQKAIAATVHVMPLTAGATPTAERAGAWEAFCRARAAWKLDPWTSQGERCLAHLDRFLRFFPLLDRERNRIVSGLAASQKTERNHG